MLEIHLKEPPPLFSLEDNLMLGLDNSITSITRIFVLFFEHFYKLNAIFLSISLK